MGIDLIASVYAADFVRCLGLEFTDSIMIELANTSTILNHHYRYDI